MGSSDDASNFLQQADYSAELHARRMKRFADLAVKFPEFVIVLQDSVMILPGAPEALRQKLREV